MARRTKACWGTAVIASSRPRAISFVSDTVGPTPPITLHVLGSLRTYCAGAAQLSISARTVRGALEDLERSQSALYRNVCDETGTVRRHLNVFVNSDNVRDLNGIDTPLRPGDVVTILPAVSGG
jgi:molybdopterin synthase sulfur carrier subunit